MTDKSEIAVMGLVTDVTNVKNEIKGAIEATWQGDMSWSNFGQTWLVRYKAPFACNLYYNKKDGAEKKLHCSNMESYWI